MLVQCIFQDLNKNTVVNAFMKVFDSLSETKYNSPKVLALNDNFLDYLTMLITKIDEKEK